MSSNGCIFIIDVEKITHLLLAVVAAKEMEEAAAAARMTQGDQVSSRRGVNFLNLGWKKKLSPLSATLQGVDGTRMQTGAGLVERKMTWQGGGRAMGERR